MSESFPNLEKETNIQIQETQGITNKINPKRPTTRHIVIKMVKIEDKETILKVARRKKHVIQGKP